MIDNCRNVPHKCTGNPVILADCTPRLTGPLIPALQLKARFYGIPAERLNGIQEVRGSIQLISTRKHSNRKAFSLAITIYEVRERILDEFLQAGDWHSSFNKLNCTTFRTITYIYAVYGVLLDNDLYTRQ
ncbi:MAG: hypothetical protein ABFD25_12890 [Clostridiaceae bacterium]